MALQKQQVPLNFVGGIDTKTDEYQVSPQKLLELENGVFTKLGSIHKRFGYDILSKNILGSSALSAGTGLTTFKNELTLFDGNKLYSYIESSEKWKERGSIASVVSSNKSIIRNVYQQTDQDYAYNQGLGCHVWKDSSGGCRYSLINEETGTFIISNGLIDATGIKPRVIGSGRYFFIYFVDGANIKFRYIQLTTPNLISSTSQIITNLDATDQRYDVKLIGENTFIAYNNNAPAVSLFYMLPNKSISNVVNLTGENADRCISVNGIRDSSAAGVWVGYVNAANVIKYAIWDYSLSVTGGGAPTILDKTSIETLANVVNITAAVTSSTNAIWLYEISATVGSMPANYIRKVSTDNIGTIGTPANFLRSVGLSSHTFEYNDKHYFLAAHSSTLQSTYFVYSTDGDIITKINQNNGGGYSSQSMLCSVEEIESGKFVLPNLKKGQLQAEDSVLYTSLGVNATTLDFKSLNNFVTAELGGSLHTVGGLLQSYDGNSINETGITLFPEYVTSALSGGAGAIPDGTYYYSIVYAWIDNDGQLHRSAPSIPLEVVVSGGPKDVILTIPTLRITKKENVFIEVYRTEVSGTIFYKTTSNTSLTLNDKTVDTIAYTDQRLDSSLISGELLYTTGGILDNIAPPPSSVIAAYKNRLVVKSSDEENLLWFSKQRGEGYPVEFSDQLRIIVEPKGGDITALGVLDEKLIIFKRDRLFLLAGDGPNNLGEQSDFGVPQLITADVGCIDVNSVVETPVGLMFKSAKGIYLLNRGLAVDYIGAEVEAYNSSRITAAKLVSDANQVRFTLEDNSCLVFDYYFKQWSTFTNHEAVGAAIYQDKFCFIKSDGSVYKENSNKYTDGSIGIKMRLVSSWIQAAEIQGWQRFYKLLVLGKYKSAHRLLVKVGFDFNSVFTQESLIDVDAVIDPDAYGDVSPYGEEDLYGGKYNLYQWCIFPKKQKCQAFRISIEDILDDVSGESFVLNAFRMEIGIKQGSNKLGTDNSSPAS